jgi:hypothetical protein
MEVLFAVSGLAMNCIAQACCWYSLFKMCGCMEERERETIRTQAPPVIVYRQNHNPFLNEKVPRDSHLEPAYK